MLDFDHPNVLRLLGVCFDTEDQLPVIILPYMANGDLKSFLVSERGDNEPSILPDVCANIDSLFTYYCIYTCPLIVDNNFSFHYNSLYILKISL